MSSVYKQLADEDLKLGKGESVLLATDRLQSGRLKGVKATLIILFIFSLTALVSMGILYDMLNKKKAEVKFLEASQIQLREKSQSYEDQIKGLSDQVAEIGTQLQDVTAQRDEFKARTEKSGSDMAALREQVTKLNEQKQSLEQKAKDLEAKVGASGAAGTADGATAPEVSKEPRILTINRQFNFVVVNLGVKDGLSVGNELTIERGGKEIGKVQVEKLYENFSAATILSETSELLFQEGDSVRRPS